MNRYEVIHTTQTCRYAIRAVTIPYHTGSATAGFLFLLLPFLLFFLYTRLERESLLLTILSSFPFPPPFFSSLLPPPLLFSFLRGEIRDWSDRPSSADWNLSRLRLSPLYQLSSRAVSVSFCFDVLLIRRLLAQTANLPLDRRFLLDCPTPTVGFP